MFTSAHPRATPSAPLDLPHGNASTRERSRLSRTAPEARHHSSLLAALQEEDTEDDEISANSVSDDDGFPFASLTLDESRGGSALHTPRGSHRLVTTKDSTESPTSPLVTHKTHSKTYGFAPPSGGAAASTPFADAFTDVPGTSSLLPSLDMFTDDDPSVTVKMRGVKDLEVTLRKNETAASLKLKLEQLRPNQYPRDFGGLGLRDPQAAGSLFFGSQELRDGPLNHYGVADGATLELRPHGNGFANAGGVFPFPTARYANGTAGTRRGIGNRTRWRMRRLGPIGRRRLTRRAAAAAGPGSETARVALRRRNAGPTAPPKSPGPSTSPAEAWRWATAPRSRTAARVGRTS